jgi:succinyl-CoA synthetase beta subunit
MILLEYEAKQLLQEFSLPIPRQQVLASGTALSLPLPIILKSQVPIGGRGKLGGVLLVTNPDDVTGTINNLLQYEIKGYVPSTLLAEEVIAIRKELYLSLVIDRTEMSMQLIAHKNGGIEIESQNNVQRWTVPYGAINLEMLGQSLADYYELPDQTFVLQDLIENLYNCFIKNDATLIEINPLILTADNNLVAGDCKMTLDDAAAFRHNWKYSQHASESNFVTINQNGDTATIANGAGLAMATVDAAYDAGLYPANFLDIGGGATAESLFTAFERIAAFPEVKVIIINIFAGITQSDEVAKAIITAKEKIATLQPLCIRIAGTNQQAAAQLLAQHSITLKQTLEECLVTAKAYVL